MSTSAAQSAGYEALGLRPVINACATLTRLGGSVMPPEVVDAMADAARCFVDLEELQRRVGARIAALTRNKAAYVSSGAAAGMVLATAACTVGMDQEAHARVPQLDTVKNQIIVQNAHRNGYDYAVRQVGVTVVDVGGPSGTTREELEVAFNDRTAAVFWFQGAMNVPGELPLDQVIEAADRRGIPVLVDAAAQLPPVENLWRFTQMGAALAIFSGGKDLAGPQSTGLVLGRADLIDACRFHGNPNQSIGRPMKVGKEELMGALAAVERYVGLDHAKRMRGFEETVARWVDRLAPFEGIVARRDFPNEAGQPVPWALITFADDATRDTIVDRLRSGDPSVAVAKAGEAAIHLNPMTLQPGEADAVLDRLIEEIGDDSSRR
ncbi:MAG: aminotransferase class V-fold PLP-dependent enzyme [Spirochaetaceae bacterium]|nr:MAG: aminotransferase class V-fold PLP-dependent enzyme [Spirochaetaceae bacterium]